MEKIFDIKAWDFAAVKHKYVATQSKAKLGEEKNSTSDGEQNEIT